MSIASKPAAPVDPSDVPLVIEELAKVMGGDVVLAAYMGVSNMSVYQWKKGIHSPSATARMLMGHIANQFGVKHRNSVTPEASGPA